ncbi:MAG TPA: M6 family metalloprotease domain-containing protein [Bacteroidales bacterium]|nr:M6 family metalloprotease domain-containing protein [Bacteroidales bacterium]
MKLKKWLFLALVLATFSLKGAYLEKIPHTVQQPDGEILHCFVTGDEYYHWMHDADWFTIVQNPTNGYYVYAAKEDGKLVPTRYIVGRVNPTTVGLTPRLNISAKEWAEKRNKMPQFPLEKSRSHEVNHGTINNLVVFIRFADQPDFSNSAATVINMFNDSTSSSSNSMYNYFKTVSYNQLFIKSHFYPEPQNDSIYSYRDSFPRAYYEKLSETNLIGYNDTTSERLDREMALLKRAIEYVSEMVPTNLELDYNEDGNIDNVCFIIKGNVGDWSDLLWPHRWSLFTEEVMLNGKRVYDFNFQLSDNSWYFSNSVLCHEMFHSLGAPDLYHYSDSLEYTPVGPWDLMGSNGVQPQHTNAYMKHRYGNWIEDIPTITQSGTYTVYKLNSTTSQRTCYKIPSENPDEFFVVECRRKNGIFESSIPGSGLLIYRINTLFTGNANWNGEDQLDEVYLYRPDGTLTNNGYVDNAQYRQGLGRTALNAQTNPQPFLSDGYVSGINIYNIYSYVDSIKFSYLKPGDVKAADFLAEGISVFPNPATDYVTVQYPNEQIREIRLLDAFGKLLFKTVQRDEITVYLKEFAKGMYFLQVITTDGKSVNCKIIKE